MSDLPPPPPDDSGWASQPPTPPEPPGQAPKPGSGMAVLESGDLVELARPLTRLVARIADGVILGLVGLLPLMVGIQSFDDLADGSLGTNLAWLAVGLVYEVSLVATRGQTLGKMVMRIKIIRAGDGLIPGWDMSAVRWLVPAIPGLVGLYTPLGLPELLSLVVYLSLTWDKVRQGWHDKAAKTLVIKVVSSPPPIRASG
ncbi:MAG: RDD family protein [Acidimicrobiaceae bacterium]|nr:RDD family protein [Acidimicrobiaceae bacterium]